VAAQDFFLDQYLADDTMVVKVTPLTLGDGAEWTLINADHSPPKEPTITVNPAMRLFVKKIMSVAPRKLAYLF
jgi:hypothetical protein